MRSSKNKEVPTATQAMGGHDGGKKAATELQTSYSLHRLIAATHTTAVKHGPCRLHGQSGLRAMPPFLLRQEFPKPPHAPPLLKMSQF
mmetsp:Transcript_29724/g.57455  ORF Transcript_29724/g.57455 Transcript_29724/m.57455 type:complete len:88 (-) Transcript_29724:835-1098(-)